jgi:hypothetical protein
MKILEKIVLHPKLENEHRNEVNEWWSNVLGTGDDKSWWMHSNYTKHGCFNITVAGSGNESAVTAFLLKYPDTKVIEEKYTYKYEIDPEALQLFKWTS